MMEAYENKYASRNPFLTLKALTYHQDINFEEPVHIIAGAYTWEAIKKRLNEMEKSPNRIFEALPVSQV
jgi:hypothetical protein